MSSADFKYGLGIHIKVMMADDAPEPFGLFPFYLRISWEEGTVGRFVEILEPLSYGNKLHADAVPVFPYPLLSR